MSVLPFYKVLLRVLIAVTTKLLPEEAGQEEL
jgi:hypothetical protein